ncbi:hypothetical protein CK203_050490 [Vitis vinifera]|uniref:Uncharacterized protein n=1 Tax=Vitis vinifera TaxID=29760 RepID=A0A438H1I0_VITVI|nr:hypothetical protein CK203_050490 [Vitis vinifera]
MCGGDDHLVWKRPISSEACRRLRIAGEERLVQFSERSGMDQQVVTVDQFMAAMAFIQEALASLRQEIGSQQSRPPVVQDVTLHDSLPPPPPPPFQQCLRPHLMYCMDILRLLHLQSFRPQSLMMLMHGMPVASLPAKFRMPDIERYTGIGCLASTSDSIAR